MFVFILLPILHFSLLIFTLHYYVFYVSVFFGFVCTSVFLFFHLLCFFLNFYLYIYIFSIIFISLFIFNILLRFNHLFRILFSVPFHISLLILINLGICFQRFGNFYWCWHLVFPSYFFLFIYFFVFVRASVGVFFYTPSVSFYYYDTK